MSTPPTEPDRTTAVTPTVRLRPEGPRPRGGIDALAQTVTPTTSQNAVLQVLALRPEVERGFLNDQAKQAVKARLFGEAEAPAKIGRFTVIRELGRGGTGIVYIVFDEQLDRKIAVKLLNNERPDERTGSANARLLREAQAMARVSHPNIAAVHEVGMFNKQIYVAMEFVSGQTLAAWQRAATPGWADALTVYRQAAAGLAAAHEAGLVHRDFKPANAILGEDRRVRVLDFGLARADAAPGGIAALDTTDEDALVVSGAPGTSASERNPQLDLSLTVTGTVLGTPAYMSPEQFLGQRVDAKSDQFSFCVSLYEALYRERPFDGDTLSSLMAAVLAGKIREPPSSARVPRWLRLAVLRGLRNDPEQRWPSMRALEQALTPERPGQRWSWLGALGVGALLTGGATAMLGGRSGADQVCGGAADQLAGVWDDARRQQVEMAMRSSGVADADEIFARTAERLDQYAADWVAARTDACEDSSVRHEQSAERMDQRITCLSERLHALAAATNQLSGTDVEVCTNAIELAVNLPAIERCDDPAYVSQQLHLPDDPNAVRIVEAARTLLTEAKTREPTGKYAEGLALVEQAAAVAKGLDYPPLQADIALRRGVLLELDSQNAAARTALEEAYFTALAAGHHGAAIDAATALVLVTGRRLQQPKVALEWARHAEAYIARAGDDLQRARLELNRGLAAYLVADYGSAEDRHAKAREFYDSALKVYQKHGREFDIARIYMWIGETYQESMVPGEEELVEAYMRKSLAAYANLGVPDHPGAALVHNLLGNRLLQKGKTAEARAEYEQARAMIERSVGVEHRNYGFTLGGLGRAHMLEKDSAAAEPLLRRAAAIVSARETPTHVNAILARFELGDALFELGKLDEANEVLDAVMTDLEGLPDPNQYQVAKTALKLFHVHEKLGDTAVLLPRFAAMYDRMSASTPPGDMPPAFLAVMARLHEKHDVAAARELMLQGRANAVKMQVKPDDLAHYDEWLARHPEK